MNFAKDNILLKLNYILKNKYKLYFCIFILTLLIGLVFQLIGISSIIPLTSTFFEQPTDNKISIMLGNIFPFLSGFDNFFILLTFFISCLIISNLIFVFSIYLSAKITFSIERDIRNTLVNQFINNSYSFFFKTNNSNFISLIINETQRLCASVILPLAEIISRTVLVVGICIFLIYSANAKIIIIILIIFFSYFIYYLLLRKKILENNKSLTKNNEDLIKNSNDLFKSLREIKIYSIENLFLDKIISITQKIQKIRFFTVFFSNSPRYYMEIIMLIAIYTLFLFNDQTIDVEKISMLALYIYAFFKILPSLQGLFSQIMVARSNLNSLDVIYEKFKDFQTDYADIKKQNITNKENFKNITLENITFNYDGNKLLDKINIKINRGEKIGIKGKSGSGKTSLINLMLGMIEPQSGNLYFNDSPIKANQIINCFNGKIGIIPQNPTMIETSIKENILLGEKENKDRLIESIEIAGLDNFTLNDLDKNIHSTSLNLSGGQIQRISIARAIYKLPSILIIDEGFNQLDNDKEKKILENIMKIKDLTIVMIYHKIFEESLLDKIYSIEEFKLELK